MMVKDWMGEDMRIYAVFLHELDYRLRFINPDSNGNESFFMCISGDLWNQ